MGNLTVIYLSTTGDLIHTHFMGRADGEGSVNTLSLSLGSNSWSGQSTAKLPNPSHVHHVDIR